MVDAVCVSCRCAAQRRARSAPTWADRLTGFETEFFRRTHFNSSHHNQYMTVFYGPRPPLGPWVLLASLGAHPGTACAPRPGVLRRLSNTRAFVFGETQFIILTFSKN